MKNNILELSSQELTGQIIHIGKVEHYGNQDRPFTKQKFVVRTYPNQNNYTESITFELHKDSIAELTSYAVGAVVTVTYFLKGKEWISPEGETKYFNSLKAMGISTYVGNTEWAEIEDTNLSGLNKEEKSEDVPF
tara:strand:+ start:3612 stop:4016 length:405 start_codon:yes stop_codon:yes gene_type:complete